MVFSSDYEAINLNLGLTSSTNMHNKDNYKPHLAQVDQEQEPSLALTLSGETYHNTTAMKKVLGDHPELPCISVSVASSRSHGVVSDKSERESDDLELELDRGGGSSRLISDEDEEDGCVPTNTPRKKLRLTKEQSALLEERFKLQSTLHPKQKQALADRLNIRPRQVEVWFQNRRARTKLKQTEVDCEYLKKCCETLTDENKRLQKELQELKAMKLGHPFYMQLPAATLTMCPSCEKIDGVPISGDTTPALKGPFGLGHNKSHFHAQHIRPLLVD